MSGSNGIDFHRRITELEETIRILQAEKEELYNDLESRIVKTDNSFWSTSNAVAVRLTQAERDRNRLQTELQRLTDERDSLREDCTQFQAAKRESDKISKTEIDKNTILEREMTFYKKQCARALEDRNLFSYEIEELKRANLELERNLEDTNFKLETEIRQREETERQRVEGLETIKLLEEKLVECSRIPLLENELRIAKHQRNELQHQYNKLQSQSLFKELKEEREDAWQMIDQLKEDKEQLQQELTATRESLDGSLSDEKAHSIALEAQLEETKIKLAETNSQLQEADARAAAAQAQAELFKESHQQEVNEAKIELHKTVARLKMQLEEVDGLLNRKMAEVKAAVEAKVTAQESASDWESKYNSIAAKMKDLEKQEDKGGGFLSRRSLEMGSFKTSGSDKYNWFRRKSKQSLDFIQGPELKTESLRNALDLVLELTPKLKSINDLLEAARPGKTGSRRESLSKLEKVKTKTFELKKELDEYPISPNLDDEKGRMSAHLKIGHQAVNLSIYAINRLQEFINAGH